MSFLRFRSALEHELELSHSGRPDHGRPAADYGVRQAPPGGVQAAAAPPRAPRAVGEVRVLHALGGAAAGVRGGGAERGTDRREGRRLPFQIFKLK